MEASGLKNSTEIYVDVTEVLLRIFKIVSLAKLLSYLNSKLIF